MFQRQCNPQQWQQTLGLLAEVIFHFTTFELSATVTYPLLVSQRVNECHLYWKNNNNNNLSAGIKHCGTVTVGSRWLRMKCCETWCSVELRKLCRHRRGRVGKYELKLEEAKCLFCKTKSFAVLPIAPHNIIIKPVSVIVRVQDWEIARWYWYNRHCIL